MTLDTSPDIEERQIATWRRLTPSAKLAMATRLTMTVRQLAAAGVRRRYPEASPHEQFLRLAIVMLGEDLARRAYPDIDTLRTR